MANINQTDLAVVGAGRWGVHLVRNFLNHPQSRLVAVLDPNQARLAALREQFKLTDVVLATHWEELKKMHPQIEAVAIATPAATHYNLIAAALKQGYHVLAEKPLTLDPTQCVQLCQLAEQQQRQLMVDHTYLFHPVVEQGQAVIAQKSLGQLRYGYATRTHLGPVRGDVDALWDLAIHDIAIFNTWLGQTPIAVQATGTVWLQPKPNLADLVWATLTYPDGFQCFIHLCWLNQDKQRRLGVVGSKGTLIFDEMSPSAPLTLLRGEFEQTDNSFVPINQSREVIDVQPGEPLGRVCDRFLHSIRHNTPSLISSGWVGTQLVQILNALTQSLQQGGKQIAVK